MTSSPLAAGTRLGPYEIVSPLGAGGMGEVWKARDTRLDRSVAIKVLPAEFAENTQLKLRFEREAKTISQLNHPNICTLYDVGDGYLVMELLEGESLADRLSRGPMPMEQVLRYGIEIAEALDRAHKAGVVHRDLKPGNVMITKSGAKLLDFGLAKPSDGGVLAGELTSMRTEKRSLTEEGSIVGTFQYMAPEQIEAGDVDARTDIFALGALLYEMATGRHAFDGRSKASLIASILTTDPKPVSAVLPMTPAAFDRVVRACLRKEPDERMQSAHDVATELRWIAEGSDTPGTPTARRRRQWIPWAIAAVASAIAVGSIVRERSKPAQPLPTIRFQLNAPASGAIHSFAISPDRTSVALVANDTEGRQLLWIRKRSAAAAVPLPNTHDAQYPFWSPDSRYIAYFAAGALHKIDTAGGSPQVLHPARNGRGGSWNQQGDIIFTISGSSELGRISSNGGPRTSITKLNPARGESTHRWPVFLPDGRHFVYLVTTFGSSGQKEKFGLYAGSLDSKDEKFLVRADSNAAYANGYLFFSRQSTLYAVRFHPEKLEVSGNPFPVVDGLRTWPQVLWSEFAASDDLLLYQLGTMPAVSRLAWFDRAGTKTSSVTQAGYLGNPRISPDGQTVAFDVTDLHSTNADICVLRRDRPTPRRITFDAAAETQPMWSPDGKSIYYFSWAPHRSIARISIDGRSRSTLASSGLTGFPIDITPDGGKLLVSTFNDARQFDLDLVSTTGSAGSTRVVGTAASESDARISPDGSMLAYTSNETGRPEIYLTTFPEGVGRWQVSSDGGTEARWRRDGQEMYYIDLQNRIVAVAVGLSNPPEIGSPQPLFRPDFRDAISGNDTSSYDVTPDGKSFVVNVTDPIANDAISAVLNWYTELSTR